MRPECSFVFIDLIQEEVVRVVRQHEDVKLKATRLLNRLRGIFFYSKKKFLTFRRDDVQINCIDIGGTWFRHGAVARERDYGRC